MSALLHSITWLPAGLSERDAHCVFRDAVAGAGGTAPLWTECGDDPYEWVSPPDAAGGLLRWDRHGYPVSAQPVPVCRDGEPADAALFRACALAVGDLGDAGGAVGMLRAAYFSCGARSIALCQISASWVITVCRDEDAPRMGGTEAAIAAACPQCTIVLRSSAEARARVEGTIAAQIRNALSPVALVLDSAEMRADADAIADAREGMTAALALLDVHRDCVDGGGR